MARNYFDLNINAPLFTELSKLPEWWKTIINDNSLYVNVRKNNRINVYYRGASVMELSMNRNKSIQGKIRGFPKKSTKRQRLKKQDENSRPVFRLLRFFQNINSYFSPFSVE